MVGWISPAHLTRVGVPRPFPKGIRPLDLWNWWRECLVEANGVETPEHLGGIGKIKMSIGRNRKGIIVGAAVLGLITIIVLSRAIRRNDGEPVQTGKVERRSRIDSKVQASGQIMPVQIYNITAEVSGRVEQIYVHEGDTVKKGQPLVKVDPTQFSLQTEGARATVSAAQADSANQRVAVQSAQHAVSQAQANLSAAQSDLERDKADFRYAQAEYNRNMQLVEQGVISKSIFDQYRSKYEQ